MLYPVENNTDIGVIVGRFQVHKLHKGHHDLIQSVKKRHRKVLIAIGNSPLLVTRNNPLDYQTRARMLQKEYPDIMVTPIKDEPTDDGWSKVLDSKIREVFEQGTVTIYGSRDSFIPYYTGAYPTVELDPSVNISATEIRNSVSLDVRDSEDFRHGVVYAAYNKFSTSYQCVDMALVRPNDLSVVLIRKHKDPAGLWRFPGGFVSPSDESLETAARRELNEEVGTIECSRPVYLGSYRIPDWRYAKEQDKIMTALFYAEYNYGNLIPGDDADEANFFKISSSLKDKLVDNHKALLDRLISYLKKEKFNDQLDSNDRQL